MATVISGSDNFNTNNVATQTELDAIPSPVGVGEGQTWQNVGRAFNTDYTNTSGKTIVVAVGAYNNSGGSANHFSLMVDGAGMSHASLPNSNAYTETTIWAFVPNGSTYRLVQNYGTTNFAFWYELR